MKARFWKVQSVGNDFVLVLRSEVAGADLPALARRLCHRRFSIGSDGLLVLDASGGELALQFYNPDGTTDFCGNGLRCAALLAANQGWAASHMSIRFWDQTVEVDVEGDLVTATLPSASFEPADVPVLSDTPWIDREVHGLFGTALTTGSTHFVILSDTLPSEETFQTVSPLIECDPVFPERTTVMWTVPSGEASVDVRIWERGAGETLGCGTGAVASAVVQAARTDRFGEWTVQSKGGTTWVVLSDLQSPIRSATRPKTVYAGEIDL